MINLKSIYYISKKEFADNIRNKWVILLTSIFIILSVVASVLGGGGTLGGMSETVTALLSISSLLIPLVGIMLGYATISGEEEKGSLPILLSYPVRRVEVILGKFFGLGSVIAVSVFLGFGLSGLVIAFTVSSSNWLAYLTFILLTILLGLVFLSLAICFSALLKKRSTSLGAGIFIFFWGMIMGSIIFGIYYLATGVSPQDLFSNISNLPAWFWASIFLSPMDMNQTSILFAFGIKQTFGVKIIPPDFINIYSLVGAQLLWMIIPLTLGYYFFKRRDI